ncbi:MULTISPECIES: S1C family serine protease [Enorma]|uniref:S1C family serine protease n=1 Tax=Enorma TaxID=1472762 RepID=UPI00034ACD83|nr:MULTISPECIES: trypsin-like peptidase domain-containing protein [Enorma]
MDERDFQHREGAAAGEGTGSSPRISIETNQTPSEGEGQGGAAWQSQPTVEQPSATAYQHASGTQAMPQADEQAGAHWQHAAQQAAPATATVDTRTVVKTKTKKMPVFLASLAGLVVGAVLVIALVMTGALNIGDSSVDAPALSGSNSAQTIKIDAEDTTLAEAVAAKALPSVVSISAVNEQTGSGGVGSGVILDTDGNVLTNYHVIEGATAVSVEVDGESYEADIVGSDASSDLAVVRLKDIDTSTLTPIEVGDSDDITVGEWVMAIGSPFGNEQSVSTGIVSALYRSTALTGTSGTAIYANMIQTDAAINPGNSGGALVNAEGQLIGINSVIESYSGSSAGVGFAIPSNYAINIAEQIIAGETPAHPYIGVTVTSVNAFTARDQGLPVSEGAVVTAVNPDSPAAEAGLEVDDIVTAVNGEPVTSADGLIIAAREHQIGETITLTVVRGDKTQDIEVTLGSDADLQENSQDGTTGDSSGSLMNEDEFRQYLEDLMANQ